MLCLAPENVMGLEAHHRDNNETYLGKTIQHVCIYNTYINADNMVHTENWVELA